MLIILCAIIFLALNLFFTIRAQKGWAACQAEYKNSLTEWEACQKELSLLQKNYHRLVDVVNEKDNVIENYEAANIVAQNTEDSLKARISHHKKETADARAERDQALKERDFYAEENTKIRDAYVQDTEKLRRALMKMQTRWIMHHRSHPILVQAVKALVNLNTNLWGGRTPPKWPRGYKLKNVLIEVFPEYNTSKSEAWGILDNYGQALDFLKKTPSEWKQHD